MANLIQMTIIFTIGIRITKKKWSSPHNQQMNLKCSTWVQPQKKKKRMISVPFQGKPFNIQAYTVIQVYSPATDAEAAEVDLFYEDLPEWVAYPFFSRSSRLRNQTRITGGFFIS